MFVGSMIARCLWYLIHQIGLRLLNIALWTTGCSDHWNERRFRNIILGSGRVGVVVAGTDNSFVYRRGLLLIG